MDKKRILWIDDDSDMVKSTKVLLEKEGWQVYTSFIAKNCKKKVKALMPDLNIMDIIFEKTHGFSLIEEIKSNPGLNKIPIIIYSGYTSRWNETTATREDGLLTQAKEFVDKSAGNDELISTIHKYI